MTAAAPPLAGAAATAADSGRALYWRLIWIYLLATVSAVTVSMGLGLLGLEFSPRQWLLFWACVPAATAFFTSIDFLVIRGHLKPLAPVLSALDRGERLSDAVLAGISWLTREERAPAMKPPVEVLPTVSLTGEQMRGIFLVTVLLIPGLIAFAGSAMWWWRR